VAAVAVSVVAQAQNVYKSVGPDGRVTYSDMPPAHTERKENPGDVMSAAEQERSAATPASQAPPPPIAKGWQRDDLAPVMMAGLMLAACESAHPGFEGRRSPTYLQWRKRYEPRLTELEKDSDYMAQLRKAQDDGRTFRQKATTADSQDRLRCDAMLSDLSAQSAIDSHPEHFATPEATWGYFLQSLRAGDREAVRSCLWGDLVARIAPALDSMNAGQMREFADSFERIWLTDDMGHVRFYGVTQKARDEHGRTVHQVNFQRSDGGWRITSM
jgi:uncharacterized protein DUF4124